MTEVILTANWYYKSKPYQEAISSDDLKGTKYQQAIGQAKTTSDAA
ncbi:MAG: hypothetical protein JO327_01910 [Nitrososphaeraceae archaeon]|nr:hypothetical protein [Nitrososphaeraceae archaeon]MBV9666865.1 hypothetical protein [Nitrososphaeraceae archaeon]